MNRNLQRGTWRGNLVIVVGNEWGDIMHADLLLRAGLGSQDERCSLNHYLAPGLHGLESDRLPLGLIYHEPREHAAPQAAPTAFDTTSYLARYKA